MRMWGEPWSLWWGAEAYGQVEYVENLYILTLRPCTPASTHESWWGHDFFQCVYIRWPISVEISKWRLPVLKRTLALRYSQFWDRWSGWMAPHFERIWSLGSSLLPALISPAIMTVLCHSLYPRQPKTTKFLTPSLVINLIIRSVQTQNMEIPTGGTYASWLRED